MPVTREGRKSYVLHVPNSRVQGIAGIPLRSGDSHGIIAQAYQMQSYVAIHTCAWILSNLGAMHIQRASSAMSSEFCTPA